MAKKQLKEVVTIMRKYAQEKMLFVYDRGYPSEEFIQLHIDFGVDFLFRVPKNFNREIKKIYKSQESENFLLIEKWPMLRVIQFNLSSGEREFCSQVYRIIMLFLKRNYRAYIKEDGLAEKQRLKKIAQEKRLNEITGQEPILWAQIES